MKIWGYWTTLLWAIVAFVVSQFVALVIILWLGLSDLGALISSPFDGVAVTVFIAVANPIMIGVVALAIAIKRAPIAEYLALNGASARNVALGLACLVALIAVGDLALYLSGYPLITPFQLQSYTTASAQGWVWALWLAAVILAPAGEEVLFRGFLFRGWARTPRTVWPAIVIISVLWAALHVQYDWTGILQIFIIGLFLGWMRLRGGSTLLTFVLHALFNLEGTLETVAKIKFFS